MSDHEKYPNSVLGQHEANYIENNKATLARVEQAINSGECGVEAAYRGRKRIVSLALQDLEAESGVRYRPEHREAIVSNMADYLRGQRRVTRSYVLWLFKEKGYPK